MLEEVVLSFREAPKDKYLTTYSILVLLGCGFLFPYNSFITAADYFKNAYPTHNVEFAFPAVYTSSLLVSMAMVVKWGRGYSFKARIAGPFVLFLLVMCAIPIADAAVGGQYTKSNDLLFYGTLFLIFTVGVSDAITQGSLYGLAGLLPPIYSHAVMNGNGVAGLVTSVLRVGTKISFPDTNTGLRTSSLIYFSLSAVIMLFCLVGYFVLMRLPFTKHYLNASVDQNQDIEMVMLNEITGLPSNELETRSEDRPIPIISVKMVIYKTWKLGLAVGFDFFVTLLGFPGLISTIPPLVIPTDWYPIILIAVFNLFDFIGKSSAALTHRIDWTQPKQERTLFILVAARIAFIVLFVTCVHVRAAQQEAFVILVVGLFGFSGGFLGATIMMVGPLKVSGAEKEVAGTVMAFFLVLGLAIGASASFLVEEFVKW
eukprot:Phypoly_transcript_09264.p1 GENE.Phypoly_transcript_09264~~Phypoly_transcript_09264.p1  ORF type:complete len:429 (+),score=51.86 Phypoly_transcript_09264:114-1400(+)